MKEFCDDKEDLDQHVESLRTFLGITEIEKKHSTYLFDSNRHQGVHNQLVSHFPGPRASVTTYITMLWS